MQTKIWSIALIFGITVSPIAHTTEVRIYPDEAGACEHYIIPAIALMATCGEIFAGVFYLVQDQDLIRSLDANHTLPNLALQNTFHDLTIASGITNIISGFFILGAMYNIGQSFYDNTGAKTIAFCAVPPTIGLTLGLIDNYMLWDVANSVPLELQNIVDKAIKQGFVPLLVNGLSTTAVATASALIFLRLKKFSKAQAREAANFIVEGP